MKGLQGSVRGLEGLIRGLRRRSVALLDEACPFCAIGSFGVYPVIVSMRLLHAEGKYSYIIGSRGGDCGIAGRWRAILVGARVQRVQKRPREWKCTRLECALSRLGGSLEFAWAGGCLFRGGTGYWVLGTGEAYPWRRGLEGDPCPRGDARERVSFLVGDSSWREEKNDEKSHSVLA